MASRQAGKKEEGSARAIYIIGAVMGVVGVECDRCGRAIRAGVGGEAGDGWMDGVGRFAIRLTQARSTVRSRERRLEIRSSTSRAKLSDGESELNYERCGYGGRGRECGFARLRVCD
jgi:hypothetical protein